MFITCVVDISVFGEGAKENKKIVVDADPHEEIENLKVLVSLKLTEIDPAGLEIYFQGRKVPNNIQILKLGMQPEDYVLIKRKPSSSCLLI